jgi:Fe-S cluster biogenesis protein NfuA
MPEEDDTELLGKVQRRVNSVSRLFGVHGGGLQLEVLNNGHAEVSFTGMCTGCLYRAVCTEVQVQPALRDIEGVTHVTIKGSSVNPAAAESLAANLRRSA